MNDFSELETELKIAPDRAFPIDLLPESNALLRNSPLFDPDVRGLRRRNPFELRLAFSGLDSLPPLP